MPMVPYTDPKAVAPTPPSGPTTYAGIVSILVGLVIAVLSLFDVTPAAEDVQQMGVIIGGLLALGSFVVTAISRTKQANNLAALASAERLAPRSAALAHAASSGGASLPTEVEIESWSSGGPVAPGSSESAEHYLKRLGGTPEAAAEHAGGRRSSDTSADDMSPRLLGEPEDPALEVPGGGPRPDDAPAALAMTDAEIAADEPGISDEVRP